LRRRAIASSANRAGPSDASRLTKETSVASILPDAPSPGGAGLKAGARRHARAALNDLAGRVHGL
jgi:hypothetical protein